MNIKVYRFGISESQAPERQLWTVRIDITKSFFTQFYLTYKDLLHTKNTIHYSMNKTTDHIDSHTAYLRLSFSTLHNALLLASDYNN